MKLLFCCLVSENKMFVSSYNRILIEFMNYKMHLSLKHQIESILPKCEVTISNLIMRTNEPKASKINEEVNRLIKSANINFVENSLVSVVYI